MIWNASVSVTVNIDYDDIEADTEEEAIQIAKDRALEDIDYNNCDADTDNPIAYCWHQENKERDEN